jgi:hypothetical protein
MHVLNKLLDEILTGEIKLRPPMSYDLAVLTSEAAHNRAAHHAVTARHKYFVPLQTIPFVPLGLSIPVTVAQLEPRISLRKGQPEPHKLGNPSAQMSPHLTARRKFNLS